jgi:hypothetical protein
MSITNIIVSKPESTVVVAGNIGPRGPAGPQGPSGESTVGGYGVAISSLNPNDVLAYNGTVWANKSQELLTEGGNF